MSKFKKESIVKVIDIDHDYFQQEAKKFIGMIGEIIGRSNGRYHVKFTGKVIESLIIVEDERWLHGDCLNECNVYEKFLYYTHGSKILIDVYS